MITRILDDLCTATPSSRTGHGTIQKQTALMLSPRMQTHQLHTDPAAKRFGGPVNAPLSEPEQIARSYVLHFRVLQSQISYNLFTYLITIALKNLCRYRRRSWDKAPKGHLSQLLDAV
ncbi:UNVERIFIED_CONTAM: hypothetical protein K2H54_008830 [Gekko kuhli]